MERRTIEMSMMDKHTLAAGHTKHFGEEPAALFVAPGRVNLIGEHTDYAEGFVFPAAINLETTVAISPRSDGRIVLYSQNFETEASFEAAAVPPHGGGKWHDYPLGVLATLSQMGIRIPAFSMTIAGNVPLGAGLSSSASIEVASALAMLHMAGKQLPKPEIARLSQRAENEYVGAPCGIMDQFVSACGAADHALLLDCRSLEYRLAPLPHDVSLVIINSMVKHSHADGAYKVRRAEVAEGTAVLHQMRDGIHALRDASMHDLEKARPRMPENVYRRCRHIISENSRTVAAAAALDAGNLKEMGRLMAEAHVSYRDDFEASCPEADLLVKMAHEHPDCIGARLTGGGFGGCTVNLVPVQAAEAFADALKEGYLAATGIQADIYLCKAAAGARQV
jgi:galactokinase